MQKSFSFLKDLPGTCRLAFVVLIFVMQQDNCFSQNKNAAAIAKVSVSDFSLLQSPVIDSSTNAVVIADIGKTGFVGNKDSWVSYVFKRHTRIKILNKRGFEAASVKISLYHNDTDEEKLDNIEGSTYNLENGNIVETKLSKQDIFSEKLNKNHVQKKFTMPAVREGSIIDYTYTIISDFDFNLPEWEFQSIQYPCLWSQYEVAIPNLLGYVFVRQGVHPYFVDESGQGHESYRLKQKMDPNEVSGLLSTESRNDIVVNAITTKRKWVIKDIPPFRVENYLTTPANFIDKIEFQLSETYNGETTRDVKNNWKKATEELLSQEDFGIPIQPEHSFDTKEVDQLAGDEIDLMEKAKKIFYYVRNNFSCTDYYDIRIKSSLEGVYKTKSGNIGEINLLLIALLRKNGIHADPVLMSTREYGVNLSGYPMMDRLNYLIDKVDIMGRPYFLDASDALLGFGKLKESCYNGHARVICSKDSGSVYFLTDSIKEQKLATIFITNDEKKPGVMNGNCQFDPGYFESYKIREKIKGDGEKAFSKSIQDLYGADFDITNITIDSLKNTELPLKIHYDFSFKKDNDADILYFNPILVDAYKENIFKAAERKYPVEMPYPINEVYVFDMEIPAGYVIDELPKSARVAYNGNEGFFEYLVQKQDQNIQMRTHIKLNNATFSADDYNTLRDFFGYVVKKENEQFVFKKKK